MLMVLIMHVRMGMFHRLVNMLVLMMLGDVQPYTNSHEQPCDQELRGERLSEEEHCRNRADKGCRREIGRRPGGPQMA